MLVQTNQVLTDEGLHINLHIMGCYRIVVVSNRERRNVATQFLPLLLVLNFCVWLIFFSTFNRSHFILSSSLTDGLFSLFSTFVPLKAVGNSPLRLNSSGLLGFLLGKSCRSCLRLHFLYTFTGTSCFRFGLYSPSNNVRSQITFFIFFSLLINDFQISRSLQMISRHIRLFIFQLFVKLSESNILFSSGGAIRK